MNDEAPGRPSQVTSVADLALVRPSARLRGPTPIAAPLWSTSAQPTAVPRPEPANPRSRPAGMTLMGGSGTRVDAVPEVGSGHDLALAELAHRCANELCVATLILRNCRDEVADQGARAALDEAAACLEAVAHVHRALAPVSGDGPAVELGHYLVHLTDRLRAAYLAPHGWRCRVETDGGRVAPDVARTLGFVVCELVLNAAKHAFANGTGGTVTVALRTCSPVWQLTVSDDGRSLRAHTAPSGLPRQGLTLVRALARSLRGRADIAVGEQGTVVTVSFEPGLPSPPVPTGRLQSKPTRSQPCRGP